MKTKQDNTIGIFETRNFEFIVCGDSRYHCIQLFRKAWKQHVKEWGAPHSGWLQDLIKDDQRLEDEINWLDDVESGQVYREKEQML